MQNNQNYQVIDLAGEDYRLFDVPGFLTAYADGSLVAEDRMVDLLSLSSGFSQDARCISDAFCLEQLNEWFVRVESIEDIEDRKLKFLDSNPDLANIIRFVIDIPSVDSKLLERCSFARRILLTGEGCDPFHSSWDEMRDKWIQYLLWCGDKINIAYTSDAFAFLSPSIVPRLNKPVGSKPRTFIVYQGI